MRTFNLVGLRRLLLVLLSAVLLSGVGATTAMAAPFPRTFPPNQNQLPDLPKERDIYRALPIKTPAADRWYEDPSNLDRMKPGQIIRSRVVQTRLLGIPVPVFSKQLLFRSTDIHGKAIATATTIIIPGIPWVGSPRPVISFQEAIDAADSSCNPSHTLQTGTFKEIALLQYWVAQGFAFNIPDFDGKDNTWLTRDEGHMVLDSLRAMKNDRSLNLSQSGIGLYGFSGGALGSIQAAELRKSYAPDVKIKAAAFGGAPADFVALSKYAGVRRPGVTGVNSFTMWLGMAGLAKAYPREIDPKRLLTVEGQRILANLSGRCVYTAAATGMYRPINEYYAPGSKGINDPAVQQILRKNSPGQQVPDIPLLWWNGIWDELIPTEAIVPVVNDYWRRGADLRYYTMPVPEHIANAVAGWPPAVAWLSAVLRGLNPGPKFKFDYPSPLPPGFPGR
ncbi:putative lipase [Gordonia effusa NBRC 100432]|uniref:Putative lipase n=1 Tax=Gordonia effusa NBRC 100432 TaxID=1077974 RepID=H0QZP9_9ACTN|nr:lipase family protein [Gordonia effusa]GAB18300.1 putative lipase [Gordonia effusa NBRC 100432]